MWTDAQREAAAAARAASREARVMRQVGRVTAHQNGVMKALSTAQDFLDTQLANKHSDLAAHHAAEAKAALTPIARNLHQWRQKAHERIAWNLYDQIAKRK